MCDFRQKRLLAELVDELQDHVYLRTESLRAGLAAELDKSKDGTDATTGRGNRSTRQLPTASTVGGDTQARAPSVDLSGA